MEGDARRWLRRTILAIAAFEAAGVAVLAWWGLNEDAGWNIMRSIAAVGLTLLVLCILPAVALAHVGRALWLAAVLVALPLLLALYGHLS